MERRIGKDIIKSKQSHTRNPRGYQTRTASAQYLSQKKRGKAQTVKKLQRTHKTSSSAAKLIKSILTSKLSVITMLLLGVNAIIKSCKQLQSGGYGQGEIDEAFTGTQRSNGRLSAKGKRFIQNQEGLRLQAYYDKIGRIWTIGYGHTGEEVVPGLVITKDQADKYFDQDIKYFENYVNRVVKVPVSQDMFDAMVSYSFNTGHLGKNFLKKLNAKDYRGAMHELETGGQLKKRRAAEREMFGTAISQDNKLIQTDGSDLPIAKGRKFGGYQLVDNKVKVSQTMGEYLKQVSGKGVITSGIRGEGGSTSHASGNKIDVGLGRADDEKIIQIAVPFMQHPATVHVAFEGLGRKDNNQDSVRISRRIEAIILKRYPEIARRVKSGDLMIYHWGWSLGGRTHHATGPHLDILIDPNRLKSPKVNQGNKNLSTAKINTKKSSNQVSYKPRINYQQPNPQTVAVKSNEIVIAKKSPIIDEDLINKIVMNQVV